MSREYEFLARHREDLKRGAELCRFLQSQAKAATPRELKYLELRKVCERLEGSARLAPTPNAEDTLLLEVNPGPVVKLEAQGLGFFAPLWGQPRLAEFVPLARAERYAPSLLDEGAARITTHFRRSAWLNPTPQKSWGYTNSITITFTNKHANSNTNPYSGNNHINDYNNNQSL